MAIAFVQGAVAQAAFGASPLNLAFPAAVAAGNLIVVGAFTNFLSANTLTITDTLGNTYTKVFETFNGVNPAASIWFAKSILGGANTVKATFDVNSDCAITIHEYSGADPVTPLDQFASATGTSTTPNSGNVTTTKGGELLFGFTGTGTVATTVTAGTGYTLRETASATRTSEGSEDQLGAAVGTFSAGFTLSGSVAWIAGIATFSPVAVAAEDRHFPEPTTKFKPTQYRSFRGWFQSESQDFTAPFDFSEERDTIGRYRGIRYQRPHFSNIQAEPQDFNAPPPPPQELLQGALDNLARGFRPVVYKVLRQLYQDEPQDASAPISLAEETGLLNSQRVYRPTRFLPTFTLRLMMQTMEPFVGAIQNEPQDTSAPVDLGEQRDFPNHAQKIFHSLTHKYLQADVLHYLNQDEPADISSISISRKYYIPVEFGGLDPFSIFHVWNVLRKLNASITHLWNNVEINLNAQLPQTWNVKEGIFTGSLQHDWRVIPTLLATFTGQVTGPAPSSGVFTGDVQRPTATIGKC